MRELAAALLLLLALVVGALAPTIWPESASGTLPSAPPASATEGRAGGTRAGRPEKGYGMVGLPRAPQAVSVAVRRETTAAFDLVKELPFHPAPPTPIPTSTKKTPASRSPLVPIFPRTDRPLDLTLAVTCATESAGRHDDELGMTWQLQCGSASANRAVAAAAIAQGWKLFAGNPPIGVGMQNYSKDGLWMQIAYRLGSPAFADPFVIVPTL